MSKGKVYRYNHTGEEYPLTSKNGVELCFFATKSKKVDYERINKPVQHLYPNFYWDKDKYGKEAARQVNTSKKIIRKLEFYTSKFRPEFIDVLWRGRKRGKNLTYLGRF